LKLFHLIGDFIFFENLDGSDFIFEKLFCRKWIEYFIIKKSNDEHCKDKRLNQSRKEKLAVILVRFF
jgi:hypothetical protein